MFLHKRALWFTDICLFLLCSMEEKKIFNSDIDLGVSALPDSSRGDI